MTKRQMLECALFLFVSCLLAWILCLSDDYRAVTGVQAKIAATEKQTALFAQKLAELQGVDEQLSGATARLDEMKKLATGGSLAEMLAFCEQVCQRTGLRLRSFEPGKKTDFDFYTTQSVTIHLTGSFQAHKSFLEAMSRFEKLLGFEQIRLQKVSAKTALNMQLVFQIYRLKMPERGNNAYKHTNFLQTGIACRHTFDGLDSL